MNIIKNIYTYAFTAFGLGMIIISLSIFLVNIISIPHYSGYWQSFSEYSNSLHSECNDLLDYMDQKDSRGDLSYAELSVDECKEFVKDRESVRVRYDEMIAENAKNEKRTEVENMLMAIPWIIIGLPAFFIFNSLRRRLKNKNNN